MRTESQQRSDRAYRLMLVYKQYADMEGRIDWDELVISLFTDLRHMVDDYGVDLYKAMDASYDRYLESKEA